MTSSAPYGYCKILLRCFVILTLVFSASIANIYGHGTVTQLGTADVILVLGAAQWNGTPSPAFQARLDRAQELFAAGYAPVIIITGGKKPDDAISDSRVGKEHLIKNGIDPERIVIEEHSRTTWQNLNYARAIMTEHALRSALLVSHDFHMMRAERMAMDLSIVTLPVPVKTKNQWLKIQYAARETVMLMVYILFSI